MNHEILASARARGITRLCHFTPSRNLVHIIADQRGVLATKRLLDEERAAFNATDLCRYDGYPDHVCCSIEYPNAWYFRKARDKDPIFRDWVVLLLRPDPLWVADTKFCPRNAAAGGGRYVGTGPAAFDSMFAPSVLGAGDRDRARGRAHPAFLPTDEQAEVLVPDSISQADLLGIAVRDESQARRELARIETLMQQPPPVFIAPDFFRPEWLSNGLRVGRRPTETLYVHGGADV